jgi:hypothetical protein
MEKIKKIYKKENLELEVLKAILKDKNIISDAEIKNKKEVLKNNGKQKAN